MKRYVREFRFLLCGIVYVQFSGALDDVPSSAVNVIGQVDVRFPIVPGGFQKMGDWHRKEKREYRRKGR